MADIFDPVVCLKFIDATIVEYLTREITPRTSNPLMKVTYVLLQVRETERHSPAETLNCAD